jgi:phosphohistidine phosphatase
VSEPGTTHRLHLLRHAKSSWKERGLSDRERPLNGRGRDACKLIAAMLPRAGVRPDAVVVSPARRTTETFELIKGGLVGDFEQWTEKRLYAASTEELLAVIQELPEAVGEALVIGHNPAIESLALILAGDAGPGAEKMRNKYPTGAMASFAIAAPWARVRPTVTALERFVRPKDLR